MEKGFKGVLQDRIHAQRRQRQHRRLPVQEPQHHPFPFGHRNGRNTDIDLPFAYAHACRAILGQPFLRDVQVRHHFHPRHQRPLQVLRRRGLLVKHSVDPVPHAKP